MSCLLALENFFKNYHLAYTEMLGEAPRYYPQGERSPCIEGHFDADSELPVFWRVVERDVKGDFDNVNSALALTLHPDINIFYGHFFAAPMLFDSLWGTGELLQVWNEQDFHYLQQNMIGHLLMKQKLKQAPTWFIGTFDDGERMLTVNNSDGSVWSEIPGEEPGEKLADSLAGFIALLAPRVAPPVKHDELPMPEIGHPGIFASFKRMWLNLIGTKH